MANLRQNTMRCWARARRYVPSAILRATGALSRLAGLEQRLLCWLIPNSPADGLMTPTPETPGAIHRSFRRVAKEKRAGDYYEFGLFKGFTFWFAQQSADLLGLTHMRFFGFDSFEGLPEPKGADAASGAFRKGDYACSRVEVVDRLTRFGFDWSRAHLEEGFYTESLRADLVDRCRMGPVALALIDCDLYQSTVPALRFLNPLLQDGSILLFDDWNCFGASDAHGQRRAFREFLASSPEWKAEEFIRFGWHGQGFAMRRSDQV